MPNELAGPFSIANLRAERWVNVPANAGAYRWYFPIKCLENLGISSYCDTSKLNLHKTNDGMIGLYFGIASSLSQRLEWHAAQRLSMSAMKSGFLSTYRLSLLALTNIDYLDGEGEINDFMDHLKISWIVTTSKTEAERIESAELTGQYHYPINIQGNKKPELANFIQHLKELRRNYRRRYIQA